MHYSKQLNVQMVEQGRGLRKNLPVQWKFKIMVLLEKYFYRVQRKNEHYLK